MQAHDGWKSSTVRKRDEAIHDGDATPLTISEGELIRMLGFHVQASARRIAQLAGELQSPQVRGRLMRIVGELERAEQMLRTTKIAAVVVPRSPSIAQKL